MKLILKTTESDLVYQRDDEHPVTMYGSAAGSGVQFDDAFHTRVCALGTIYPGINCLSINQDGVGHRDFYVPIGTPITLDGTKVTPQKYLLKRFAAIRPRSGQMYQQKLTFRTVGEAKFAVCTLLSTNVVITQVRRRCREVTFQTPYELGPVMRGVLCLETQSLSAFFNRQPQTGKKFPIWRRVTLGQAMLPLLTFLFYGSLLLISPHGDRFLSAFEIVTVLFLTVLVAYISPDILGLVQCDRRECLRQRKGVQS